MHIRSVGIGVRLKSVLATLVVGALFIIASLPDGTAALANREGWAWLTGFGQASKALKTALPAPSSMLEWINYAIVVYAAALLLVSLRHVRFTLFLWGVGISAVAAFVLHLLAWVGVIVFAVGGFVAMIFAAVFGFLAGISVWMGTIARNGLILPFMGLFEPFMGSWSWLGASLSLALLLVVFYLFGAQWARSAVVVLAWIALGLCLLVGLSWLIGLVPPVVWSTLGKVIAWTFLALLGGFAVATVGALVIDQVTSWKHAGSGRRGVLMGGIAVGSTMAVLMLVGNIYGVYSLYPGEVEAWARSAVLSDEPKFDCAMTLVVIGLCAYGVLRNIGTMRSEPGPEVFRRSLFFTIMGMISAGAVAAADKATSPD